MSEFVFKKVILDAFMSYDHEEFSVENEGIVYIKGVNNEDAKSDSNGSGKSALISDSIIWCLTGYTPRGSKEVSNRYLDRGAYVTVELTKDGVQYSITRGTNKSLVGNTIKIVKDGLEIETGKRSADEYLEQELGLDWTQLTSIVILSQGLTGSLAGMKATDRKRQLEVLAGVDSQYEALVNMINAVHTRITDKVNKLNIEKATVNGQLSTATNMKLSAQSSLERVRAQNSSLNLDANSAKVAELQTNIQVLQTSIPAWTASIGQVRTAINNKRDASLASNTKLTQLTGSINNVNTQLTNAKSKLSLAKMNVDKYTLSMSKITAGICDECGQVLPNDKSEELKAKYTTMISTETATAKSLEIEIDDLTKQLNELNSQVDPVRKEVSQYTAEIAQLNATVTDLDSKISNANSSILRMTTEINTLSSAVPLDESLYLNQITQYDSQIMECNNKLSIIDTQINSFENDVLNINFLKNKSSRDLRAYLLTGVVGFLNTRTSDYSSYLFDDKIVKLEVSSSKVDISIDGKLVESLSGGEKRRVDMIIQLALRDLVLVDTGFSSNLLVIDEALDYLDNNGISSVLELIMSQRDSISTIAVITHKSDADIVYDQQWCVMKDSNNISKRIR